MQKITKILMLAAILAAVAVLPVCADPAMTVIYPGQYYELQNQSDSAVSSFGAWDSRGGGVMQAYYYEMQRQIILLEKQNELLAEQNALLANQSLAGHTFTCADRVGVTCWAWTVI